MSNLLYNYIIWVIIITTTIIINIPNPMTITKLIIFTNISMIIYTNMIANAIIVNTITIRKHITTKTTMTMTTIQIMGIQEYCHTDIHMLPRHHSIFGIDIGLVLLFIIINKQKIFISNK